MKKDYSVRPYQLGDEEDIVQLLQQVFDGWPSLDLDCSSLDHWRWKYEDNPLKKIIIVVSEAVDGVIGFIHGIPRKIKLGDMIHLCSFGSDVAVHPDFRRMGVHNKMLKLGRDVMKEAGVEFTYFTSGNPILIKSYSKSYSNVTNTIHNLIRIQDVDLQLRMMPVKSYWMMKLGFHTVKFLNDIRNAFNGSKLADHDIHVHKIHSFDARIDIFWEKISDQYNFIIERRKDYLNWRYCDPRAGAFVIKQAEDTGGSILGYCVLRINRYIQDYPIGYLVDLLTLPDRMDVADKLIRRPFITLTVKR